MLRESGEQRAGAEGEDAPENSGQERAVRLAGPRAVVCEVRADREQNLTLRYHPGARLVFADGTPDILVYPRDRTGWGRLTRLHVVLVFDALATLFLAFLGLAAAWRKGLRWSDLRGDLRDWPQLAVMLVIALVGMPLVVAYTALIYRAFRGKTVLTPESY